jgi:hypothetical protein
MRNRRRREARLRLCPRAHKGRSAALARFRRPFSRRREPASGAGPNGGTSERDLGRSTGSALGQEPLEFGNGPDPQRSKAHAIDVIADVAIEALLGQPEGLGGFLAPQREPRRRRPAVRAFACSGSTGRPGGLGRRRGPHLPLLRARSHRTEGLYPTRRWFAQRRQRSSMGSCRYTASAPSRRTSPQRAQHPFLLSKVSQCRRALRLQRPRSPGDPNRRPRTLAQRRPVAASSKDMPPMSPAVRRGRRAEHLPGAALSNASGVRLARPV